ncbi:MAG: alanine--tRNA ligase, partial [Verrucomicrobiota bacterium]
MTSAEIRQSFLDFFASKQHRIVPSASLMPDAPNLLFTNAGMNQFVPYFLGERNAAYSRAVDTQKCIRAGGKHNDLDDVGFDAYHHTFFEMLGNWSFGDYFKKEAINWAWELITKVWKFPKERLYATVYKPGPGDPSEFDQEAYDHWKAIFEREGLDPDQHIVNGNKQDNFWMMGDTGPCGPCSEIHMDLTPAGDTRGSLVNEDSPWCIEIWNLVFIQFNAGEDGNFTPLPSKHVDTGMGFERVAGILSTTRGFTDFSSPPSNYESDLFQDIFTSISKLCDARYSGTLPDPGVELTQEEKIDFSFRAIADHIRTLSFSIADGILPGNEGRNYVLRRILRRAVLFGKKLGLPDGFFAHLADPLIDKMGPHFPELEAQRSVIKKVIAAEENTFDKTIDRGLQLLNGVFSKASDDSKTISGEDAFTLYDTYGFPIDLTELLAR